MCELCALTSTFDPARHTPGQSLSEAMRVVEGSDAAANRFTAYEINPGDTFEGTLSYAGDRDWVAVTLEAGTSYDIAIDAFYGGGGSLRDSYLRIYDANGSLRALNDDGGPGFDSALEFTASTSGTYFISVGSYADYYVGSYTVEIDETGAPTPPPVVPGSDATLDQLADYLTDGYWNDTYRSRRSFNTSSDNEITVDITGLTVDGQRLARWAMEAWEMVANLEFVEISSSSANITFDDEDSGAYSSSDTSGSALISSEVNVSRAWLSYYGTDVYSYSLQTYIHEIGHALGLGHQGNYNGSATYGSDETFRNDSWQVSIMSYFSQSENTSTNATEARLITTMMADILAIQNLYGAADSDSATGGNTVWGQGTNLDGYLGDILQYGADQAVAFTINDASGIDTINLANYSQNNLLNLNAESFSDVAGLIGNIGIARGTVIENANLGAGNDTVMGNEVNNDIRGGAGNDRLEAGDGNDSLNGGDGADTLLGQTGGDELWGMAGDDNIWAGQGVDRLVGGIGNDRLYGQAGGDQIEGEGGNDLLDGGQGSDRIWAGTGADTIVAGSGRDTVAGGLGDDRIWGGTGGDQLSGGDGADTLLGDAGQDSLYGNAGEDRLEAGDGDDSLTGGAGADTLLGQAEDDMLWGSAGDDVLWGGQGLDRLAGGSGNDRLYGQAGADQLEGGAGDDLLDGSRGADRIWAGTGADTIIAGGGHDTVVGGAGDDQIWGDSGNDTLTGGGDADVFHFNANISEGFDTITDFTSGVDVIEIANTTFAELDFFRQGDSIRVSWDTGSVLLEDVLYFGDDDFIFT